MGYPKKKRSALEKLRIFGNVTEIRGESTSEDGGNIRSTKWVDLYNENGDLTRYDGDSVIVDQYIFNNEGITIGKDLYRNTVLHEHENWECNKNGDPIVIRTTNSEGDVIRIVKHEYNDDGFEVGGSYERSGEEFIFTWTYEWEGGLLIRSTWNTGPWFDYEYNSSQWQVKERRYDKGNLLSESQTEYLATDSRNNWTEQRETQIANGSKKVFLRKRSLYYREDSVLHFNTENSSRV